MTQLQHQVRAVQKRLQAEWLWRCVSVGLTVGGGLACVLGVARLLSQGAFGRGWVMLPAVIGVLAGVVWATVFRRTAMQAAFQIDHACRLKDRTQSALQFLHSKQSDTDPLRQLQIEDAEAHAAAIDPKQVAPVVGPRFWRLAVSSSVAAAVLAMISGPPVTVLASVQSNAVVHEQADRLDDELEELRQLQHE
ncbi:MAG: hypothetical protein KDA89_05495, partial [Planctomycetaceae bacterium]|nr:hypothetical protein [Planctomycetaceae bacterium]